jgi:hypothetical protein
MEMYNKTLTEQVIFASIALVIPFFTSKAYDVYVDKKEFVDEGKDNYWKLKQNYNDKYAMKKLTAMIIVSAFCIVGGFLLCKTTSNMSLVAISLGGFIILFWNLLVNWRLFDQKKQVIILGLLLTLLLGIGTQIK